MTITLSTLRPAFGAKRGKRRVGRGLGSRGTTAGRGQKGQSARSGVGGLKRLGMRHIMLATPKLRGFKSIAPHVQAVNILAIASKYIAGEFVTPTTLMKKGLITDKTLPVKILGNGEISAAVTVKNCAVSATAAEKISKAGGSVIV
ncbi:MAG: 50S ribosomal protein L15 [Patescibacteria group bacterium]|jgi:large subunit ribosomal protein L15